MFFTVVVINANMNNSHKRYKRFSFYLIIVIIIAVYLLTRLEPSVPYQFKDDPVYCVHNKAALPDPADSTEWTSAAAKLLYDKARLQLPCNVQSAYVGRTLYIRLHIAPEEIQRKLILPLAVPWDSKSNTTRTLVVKWSSADQQTFGKTKALLEPLGWGRKNCLARLNVTTPNLGFDTKTTGSQCYHGDMAITFRTSVSSADAQTTSTIDDYEIMLKSFVANPAHVGMFAAPSFNKIPGLEAPPEENKFSLVNISSDGLYRIKQETLNPDKNILCDEAGKQLALLSKGKQTYFFAQASSSPYSNTATYFVKPGKTPRPADKMASIKAKQATFLTTQTLAQKNFLFVKTDVFLSILDYQWVWHDFDAHQILNTTLTLPRSLAQKYVPVPCKLSFLTRETTASNELQRIKVGLGTFQTTVIIAHNTSSATFTVPPKILTNQNDFTLTAENADSGLLLDKIELGFPCVLADVQNSTATLKCLTGGKITVPKDMAVLRIVKNETDEFLQDGATIKTNDVLQISPLSMAKDATVTAPTKASLPVLNGNQTIFISHPSFIPTLTTYLDKTQEFDTPTPIVNTDLIYARYSHGIKTPTAIRDYLADLILTEKYPPLYAVLVGDCSLDYREVMANGIPDLLPSMSVKTADGSTGASDHYYADLCGNDMIADLFVSRLPFRTTEDLKNYLDKAALYSSGGFVTAKESVSSKLLFVADQEPEFENAVKELEKHVLPGFNKTTLNLSHYRWTDNWYYPDALANRKQLKTSPDATKDLLDKLNDGQALVAYFGHGSPNIWSNQRLWFGGGTENSDNLLLTNIAALPFLTAFSCNVGAIDYPLERWNICITEDMLCVKNGGIIGAYVPSGPNTSANHLRLAEQILDVMQTYSGTTINQDIALAEWRYIVQCDNNQQITALLPFYNVLGLGTITPNIKGNMEEVLTRPNRTAAQLLSITPASKQPLFSGKECTFDIELRNPTSLPIRPEITIDNDTLGAIGFLPYETISTSTQLQIPENTTIFTPTYTGVTPFSEQELPMIAATQGRHAELNAVLQAIDRNTDTNDFNARFAVLVMNFGTEQTGPMDLIIKEGDKAETMKIPSLFAAGQTHLIVNRPFDGKTPTKVTFELKNSENSKTLSSNEFTLDSNVFCDISITSATLIPDTISDGETYFIDTLVSNNGGTDATDINVSVFDTKDTSVPLLSRGTPRRVEPFKLKPGQSHRVLLRVDPFNNAGEATLELRAQTPSAELNLDNNTFTVPITVLTKFKLVPTGLTLEKNATQRALNLNAKVKNFGESPAYGVCVAFFEATDKGTPVNADKPLAVQFIRELPANSEAQATYVYPVSPNYKPGDPLRFTYEVYLKGSSQRVRPN